MITKECSSARLAQRAAVTILGALVAALAAHVPILVTYPCSLHAGFAGQRSGSVGNDAGP
jgi:hypothetical protein